MFYLLSRIRRAFFKLGILKSHRFDVPLIVVGNISVGGTGKTPIVTALVSRLQAAGLKPGIVSRGYGAQKALEPRFIDQTTPVALAGDEPALLARETGVPIYICVNRSKAVQALIDNTDVNVVLSDDGLQHYAMGRDKEIAVIDGARGLGNGLVLPAGPLRETASRLHSVDLIAVQHSAEITNFATQKYLRTLLGAKASSLTAGGFSLLITQINRLQDDQAVEISTFQTQRVHAMAGLGNPQRFFDSLQRHGLDIIEHTMPDHHHYTETDLQFNDGLAILMTTKDAVKVRELDIKMSPVYEVCVEPKLDEDLQNALDRLISDLF